MSSSRNSFRVHPSRVVVVVHACMATSPESRTSCLRRKSPPDGRPVTRPAAAAAAQLCPAVRRAPHLHRVRPETLSPLLSFLFSHEHTRARISTKTAHAQHRLPSPFPNLLLSRRRRLHTLSVAPALALALLLLLAVAASSASAAGGSHHLDLDLGFLPSPPTARSPLQIPHRNCSADWASAPRDPPSLRRPPTVADARVVAQ